MQNGVRLFPFCYLDLNSLGETWGHSLQFYSFDQSFEKEGDIPHWIILLTVLEMVRGETSRWRDGSANSQEVREKANVSPKYARPTSL